VSFDLAVVLPSGGVLPDGWSETHLLPAIREIDREELERYDDLFTRLARAKEADPDADEWRRAVATVRWELGSRVEPMQGHRSDLSNPDDKLSRRDRDRRSTYALLAEVPYDELVGWLRSDPRWKQVVHRARRRRIEARPARPDLTLPDVGFGNDRVRLLHGDFRDRLADLEPASVDLILTDPPYDKESLPLFSDLGKAAARLLSPRGYLAALSGQIFLPDVVAALGEHLSYGWEFCWPLGDGPTNRIIGRHLRQTWKPVFVYTVGAWPVRHWYPDTLPTAPYDKDLFRWQQPVEPAKYLIENMTPPDGLVVDPMLGVGSFGLAAREAGRRFVGVELHAERYRTAKERLGL
jgi:hypothetical protein